MFGQLLANDGHHEGLFRAVYAESGSMASHGPIEGANYYYDNLVNYVGCTNSSDTLECLRHVPYAQFKAASDAAPSFFAHQVSHFAID